MKTRIGMGYDVHRLVQGRQLWLGGILIPPWDCWDTAMPMSCYMLYATPCSERQTCVT